ncbi:MAG: hypothetical protein ACUVRV_04635 [Cyanobacteriota bacterium]
MGIALHLAEAEAHLRQALEQGGPDPEAGVAAAGAAGSSTGSLVLSALATGSRRLGSWVGVVCESVATSV